MSVRAKVTAHGQRMLATATALGVAAACTKSNDTGAQTVTLPSSSATTTTTAPSGTSTASASASATSPLASATATATVSAKPSATATTPSGPPTHGYAVVDPMPPPSRCAGSAASAKVSGSYVKQGAETVLKINVKLGGGATWTGAAPSSYGGAVKSFTANAAKDSLDLVLGVKDYGASIPITCSAGSATIGISISGGPPPAPKVGDPVTLQLYDRY